MSHSGGDVAQLPDGDVGVHPLEVVPDHHGAVLLLVKTVHHNSAGEEDNGSAQLEKTPKKIDPSKSVFLLFIITYGLD